ncbi:methyltransferase domain-containing protein [Rhizohabitans arisaemae]|uniref:methyltransferase domain-containing protein n=1 Tax=Rhizohabitans arisaemae TaxID=2720610 RepID=UPI0024B2488B|nr:methyltransferase domain-containing protein [Rhizohabitans arisaemae]
MLPIPAIQLNGTGTLGPYWTFYRAVAMAQLTEWLPTRPSVIADVSGGLAELRGRWSPQAAAGGHRVLEVHDFRTASSPGYQQLRETSSGVVRRVRADSLAFLPDACVDAVVAEERALSLELMTESAVEDIARILRPGGRLFTCVDSLVLGMAILAEQHYWAHLRHTQEVMLVPWPDGSITRCFSAGQLRELLTEAGLIVEWIRPRTVLSPSVVDHVLAVDELALDRLVRTELDTRQDEDDAIGIHLVASARRP